MFLTEADEQQYRAEAQHPRVRSAGDTEDNQVPRSDPEDTAAHQRQAWRETLTLTQ